jgi:uncharacterized phage-associated protein
MPEQMNRPPDALEPTRVHELVLLVVDRLGTVGRTKLTKLLYLIDLAYFSRYGTTLSAGSWVRYTYGPMLRDLPRVAAEMNGAEIVVDEHADSSGYRFADYHSLPTETWRFIPQLRDHEKAVVDEIIDRYGALSREQVVKLAYTTPPMRLIAKWEADGERLDGTAIPFAKALGQPGEGLGRYRRLADAVRERSLGTPEGRQELESLTLAKTQALRQAATEAAIEAQDGHA